MSSPKSFICHCGCEAHLIKWNSKSTMISMRQCPLHKSSEQMLKALKEAKLAIGLLNNPTELEEKTLSLITSAIAIAEGK